MTRREVSCQIVAAGIALAGGRSIQAAETSPITNRWGQAKTTKPPTRHVQVFRGREGAAYSHHPQVIAHAGKLYATFSTGAAHEDDPGQRMMLAVSSDEGRTWGDPSVITPPAKATGAAYTAMGIRTHEGNLIAYYGYHEWLPRGLDADGHRLQDACYRYRDDPDTWVHQNSRTEARVSTDKGKTWGEPRKLVDRFILSLRPFPTSTGRLIMPGNILFPYTDDPAGLTAWKRIGLPRLPDWTVDDPEGFHKGCSARGDQIDYCEGSFYETGDGVLRMMLRTIPGIWRGKKPGLLAVTESRDDGASWSEPQLTGFTDCSSRFQFGRLPDGRYFGLSCPDPTKSRTPMILAASKDGVVFDRHYVLGDEAPSGPRLEGRNKGGLYGYPSCFIHDGVMDILYSMNKEDVYLARVELKDLT